MTGSTKKKKKKQVACIILTSQLNGTGTGTPVCPHAIILLQGHLANFCDLASDRVTPFSPRLSNLLSECLCPIGQVSGGSAK